MRDGDNLVGDVQSSTIHVSVQDLDIFQFKRVHILTKDRTIFIWCLVFEGKGHETRATGNTRRNGKAPPSPGRFPGKHKEGSSHNPGFHDNFSQKRLRGRGRE